MKTKKIVFEIKERFEAALQSKTGWGKNDVIKLYHNIVIEVLVENLK